MFAPMSNTCWIVHTPALIRLGEKNVFELVSLNRVECQGDKRGVSSTDGMPTGAALRKTEKALQHVPRNGKDFQGIGPSCNHGSCMGSRGTPNCNAHWRKCARETAGTDSGSVQDSRKGVACYHRRKVRGCGRLLPPRAGGGGGPKIGSVNPQLLIFSAVL